MSLQSQGSQYKKTCGKKECENIQVNRSLIASVKEKYGVGNVSQLDFIKKKKEETTLNHYGVRYLFQDPLYKKQKEEELFKIYGVKNVSQLQEVKDKKKCTFQKNYGSDCYFASEEGIKKCKETFLEKYGVDNPSKSDIIKERKKQTTLKNWGVENPFQSEEIKNRIKETCLEKYGVEYASQNPEISKKSVETNKRNHGGILNLHLPEVMKRAHSYKYFYDNQYFDSKEELALYIYCIDFNIPIERNPLSLEYTSNGTLHRYIVDLKINGQLCEFKGGMLINDEGVWIPDPWRLNSLKDNPEALEREYVKYAEKQKCALDNGVKILTEKDVKPYMSYCASKFKTKKWYLQFRQPQKLKP